MERSSNAKTFRLEIVSAERSLFSGEANFVVVPGVDGDLGIFPNHTPLLTKIKPGTLKFHAKDEPEETLFFVAGGFLEVQPTVVTVLADTVIRGEEIDQARAEEAKRNAEEAIARAPEDKIALATAQAELSYAMAELRTLQKYKARS
ncbi:MAG: F0F1 ATP synthase subunit epsilon [Burkholderiaceae bacterium]